jgi:hypothetical protein
MAFEDFFTPLENPKIDKLNYPFSFIGEEYEIADICRGFVDEPPVDPGDFPNNIIEYYWIYEGENDGDAWECVCKLANDAYVFYSGSCDYTGFDCQGGMELHISMDRRKIYDYFVKAKGI